MRKCFFIGETNSLLIRTMVAENWVLTGKINGCSCIYVLLKYLKYRLQESNDTLIQG